MGIDRSARTLERLKRASRALRGRIAAELDDGRPCFSPETVHLLKFHGVLQYEHRDCREGEARWGFHLRVRPTGGRLTGRQWQALCRYVRSVPGTSLRLTSRQGVQLEGLEKKHLKPAIASLAAVGLSTFAAAGDVNCNVMACPAPSASGPVRAAMEGAARAIAEACMPLRDAYDEIWLGRPASSEGAAVRPDPLYGPTYLPHKFKVALALPSDNCTDVFIQDVGLLAVVERGLLSGFEVLVGGGLGMIPSVARTAPTLARPFAFVPLARIVDVVRAILLVYRDAGCRERRSAGRLKHLLRAWGLERFREVVAARLAQRLAPPRGVAVTGRDDHLGWQEEDGSVALGLAVPGGRLGPCRTPALWACLEALVGRWAPACVVTPGQDLLLRFPPGVRREDVCRVLDAHGLSGDESDRPELPCAMACPALPTCPAAITEAERILPAVVAMVESELRSRGFNDGGAGRICVTGCPSGCARPYVADLAIIGRSLTARDRVPRFAVYIGGDRFGRRINTLYRDLVPWPELPGVLRPLLASFVQSRRDRETLGDFLYRTYVVPAPKREPIPGPGPGSLSEKSRDEWTHTSEPSILRRHNFNYRETSRDEWTDTPEA